MQFNYKKLILSCSIALLSLNAFSQTGQKWAIDGISPSGADFLGTNNSFPIVFKTNKTEWMRLTPNGFLGIGVANPLTPLHVAGQIRSNSLAGTGFRLLQTDNSGNINVLQGGSANHVLYGNGTWGALPTSLASSDWNVNGNNMSSIPSGNVGIGVNNPTEKLDVNGNIRASKIITTIFDSPTEKITFGSHSIVFDLPTNSIYTDNTSLFIQSNPSFNFNTIINYGNTGFVGIGTATPTQTLDVSGNTNISGNATIGQNTTVAGAISSASLAVAGTITTANMDVSGNLNAANFTSGTVNAASLALAGNMTANCVSSVALNVSGQATVDNILVNDVFKTDQILTSSIGSGGTDNVINFGAGAMSVNTVTGNTTISGNLDVNGLKLSGFINGTNQANHALEIDEEGNLVVGSAINDPHSNIPNFVTPCEANPNNYQVLSVLHNPVWIPNIETSQPKMFICDPVTFVGIGNINPGAKLDIVSNNEVGLNLNMQGNAGSRLGFRIQANTDDVKAISVERSGIEPKTNFLVNGNGDVFARRIKVTLESFGDYVFEKNYHLMPLVELENYVNTNKHLPGISPAKEILRDGVDLGELVSQQMVKIEELTLYLIELKKQNQDLTNRLVKLEK